MSENCPVKDIHTLKWSYSLPEFLKLKEYVEMIDNIKQAVEKDHEVKNENVG